MKQKKIKPSADIYYRLVYFWWDFSSPCFQLQIRPHQAILMYIPDMEPLSLDKISNKLPGASRLATASPWHPCCGSFSKLLKCWLSKWPSVSWSSLYVAHSL